jgi:hypothetical protein
MRLMLMMVLMLLAAASHAQPVAAPTPPVQAPAAIRNADDASEKSKLEAAAEAKKLDGAESAPTEAGRRETCSDRGELEEGYGKHMHGLCAAQ